MEIVWKVVETVIDIRVKVLVQSYDVCGGFAQGGGQGTQ